MINLISLWYSTLQSRISHLNDQPSPPPPIKKKGSRWCYARKSIQCIVEKAGDGESSTEGTRGCILNGVNRTSVFEWNRSCVLVWMCVYLVRFSGFEINRKFLPLFFVYYFIVYIFISVFKLTAEPPLLANYFKWLYLLNYSNRINVLCCGRCYDLFLCLDGVCVCSLTFFSIKTTAILLFLRPLMLLLRVVILMPVITTYYDYHYYYYLLLLLLLLTYNSNYNCF